MSSLIDPAPFLFLDSEGFLKSRPIRRDVLELSCRSNGLSTHGTKADMLRRLWNDFKAKQDMHVPYKGDPLPDDIVRFILKYAAEEGVAARAVCKTWLRVSNSLLPFFLNRIKAVMEQHEKQIRIYHTEVLEMAWPIEVTRQRLQKKMSREKMVDMLSSYDLSFPETTSTGTLAIVLAEQLHYETADESDDGDDGDDVFTTLA